MLIATATGAFGNRWWLNLDTESGKASITRERTPGGDRRTMEFDSMQEAWECFNTYTTPIVEQVAEKIKQGT
jgi:hypothetical protein